VTARLDRALKRAGISSARAAKWLRVSESEVQYWRRGITVPPVNAFIHLAILLNPHVHWLCTGQPQAA
jgi:hypothetical protein